MRPDFSRVTFILALPRSATFWSTQFVAPGVMASLHDPLGPVAGDVAALRDQVAALLESGPGRVYIADTGAAMFYQGLAAMLPRARWGAIVRPRAEVEASLAWLGMTDVLPHLPAMERCLLRAIDALPHCFRVGYRRPFDEVGADRIYRAATGERCHTLRVKDWCRTFRESPKDEQMARVGPAFGL